ncbi:MAG: hypothetical protein KF785_11535 [Gemmatimonadales bacterium]|nr:hypothetical protein [Gemmatimonadales bacterium]
MTTFYFVCVGIGGALLLLQTGLSIFGHNHDGGHHDLGGDGGLDLFSVRTLAAGAAFFGIGGLAGQWLGLGSLLSLPIGVVAGFGSMLGVAHATRVLRRLDSDRSAHVAMAIGEAGFVYLTVPGQRASAGKVHVTLNGRLAELNAVTDGATLATGSAVRVVDIVDDETIVVASDSVADTGSHSRLP